MTTSLTPWISAEQIADQVERLAKEIGADYAGKRLVLISVLKGSFVFLADLARALARTQKLKEIHIEFLGVSSYGSSTRSSGVVQITADVGHSIEGEDVLLVEDIVDTGLTLGYLLDNLQTRYPSSLKVCSLLKKNRPNVAGPMVDYFGFVAPEEFVVGYGLDWAERHRELPYLALLPRG